MGDKPLSASYAKAGAYVDGNMELGGIFRVKCFHEFAGTNASAPTVQLQRIMVLLAVIAYREWDFSVTDVSRAFSTSGSLKRDTYVQLPGGVEKGNAAWKPSKPLYGVSSAFKDWYGTIRYFLSKECGRRGG